MASKFKALIEAVEKNSLTSVKQLLSDESVEFDINEVIDRKSGRTILHVAVANKTVNIELVKLLLHNNAEVNVQDRRRISPLYTAVQNNCMEVVELLLKCGADPNCLNGYKETPFHYWLKTGNILLMNLMLKYHGDINVKDSIGRNALYYAAKYGTCEMVESLIQMGMDVNEKSTNGETPLHGAALNYGGNTEDTLSKIRLLMNSGANINEPSYEVWNFTPLNLAVSKTFVHCKKSRTLETINYLLELGANPNFHGNDDSPLFLAASRHEIKLVELLLKYGADVHFKDANGRSVLNTVMIKWHYGKEDDIVKNALHIVKVLLIQGIQLTQNDHLGVEPSIFKKLKECESEYNNLKITRICESSPLTYGDLLIISNHILARHLRRKDVCAAIEFYHHKKDFINYFSENIEKKYLSGLKLKKMLDDFIDLLDEVFETVLHHDIVVLISEYFTEDDLNKCFSKNQEDR